MASESKHGSGYNIGYGGTATFYRNRLGWASFCLRVQHYSEPSIWVPEANTPLRPPIFPLFHSCPPFPPLLAKIYCSFMIVSYLQVLGTECWFCLGPGVLGFICGHIHPEAFQGAKSLGPQRGNYPWPLRRGWGSRQLHRRITCWIQSCLTQRVS